MGDDDVSVIIETTLENAREITLGEWSQVIVIRGGHNPGRYVTLPQGYAEGAIYAMGQLDAKEKPQFRLTTLPSTNEDYKSLKLEGWCHCGPLEFVIATKGWISDRHADGPSLSFYCYQLCGEKVWTFYSLTNHEISESVTTKAGDFILVPGGCEHRVETLSSAVHASGYLAMSDVSLTCARWGMRIKKNDPPKCVKTVTDGDYTCTRYQWMYWTKILVDANTRFQEQGEYTQEYLASLTEKLLITKEKLCELIKERSCEVPTMQKKKNAYCVYATCKRFANHYFNIDDTRTHASGRRRRGPRNDIRKKEKRKQYKMTPNQNSL